MGFSTPVMQRDFWTAFLKTLDGTGFKSRQPTTNNYIYLPLGNSHAKIVLVAPTGTGGIACKLSLGASRSATMIYQSLHNERSAIEAELGFRVAWGVRGTGQSSTRIYRNRQGAIENRSNWPEAFAWLLNTATKFRQVFVPRIRQLRP